MLEADADEEEIPLERLLEMADDRPAQRIVDLILRDAAENRISQLWILAVRASHQFHTLVLLEGQWQQRMSQTWLLLPSMLGYLKARAGIDPRTRDVFREGSFRFENQGASYRVDLRILPGEHQDEAHLRISLHSS